MAPMEEAAVAEKRWCRQSIVGIPFQSGYVGRKKKSCHMKNQLHFKTYTTSRLFSRLFKNNFFFSYEISVELPPKPHVNSFNRNNNSIVHYIKWPTKTSVRKYFFVKSWGWGTLLDGELRNLDCKVACCVGGPNVCICVCMWTWRCEFVAGKRCNQGCHVKQLTKHKHVELSYVGPDGPFQFCIMRWVEKRKCYDPSSSKYWRARV